MKDSDECPVGRRFHVGLLHAAEDAERRLKRGEKQALCTRCERWRWPDHQMACPDFRGRTVGG